MGYDFNGNSDFWRTVKAVGLEFVKAGVVVAGIAASVALVVGAGAATYFSGGAAAVAVPAIMTVAATLVKASVAVAAVGAGVAVAGAAGENIEYSKSSPKGKSFRGGTKNKGTDGMVIMKDLFKNGLKEKERNTITMEWTLIVKKLLMLCTKYGKSLDAHSPNNEVLCNEIQ